MKTTKLKIANLKNTFFILNLMILTNPLYAKAIEAQLKSTAKAGQKLLLASLPIFMLSIGYLYKRGKSEAKERAENLVIGAIFVATAFGWSYFFK